MGHTVLLGDRIQDLIGTNFSANSWSTENEAIRQACIEVIDSLSSSYLLKYSDVEAISTSSPDSTVTSTGKRVLRVLRADSGTVSEQTLRICEEVDEDVFEEMLDEDSIYAPTQHSPIYTRAGYIGEYVKVRPLISEGLEYARVYTITYPTDENMYLLTSITGLPNEVEHLIALKSSILILHLMISDTIQDDEDEEELALLNTQLQLLTAMYQTELQRILKNPEGEASD
jgi:hypothetical protein